MRQVGPVSMDVSIKVTLLPDRIIFKRSAIRLQDLLSRRLATSELPLAIVWLCSHYKVYSLEDGISGVYWLWLLPSCHSLAPRNP